MKGRVQRKVEYVYTLYSYLWVSWVGGWVWVSVTRGAALAAESAAAF